MHNSVLRQDGTYDRKAYDMCENKYISYAFLICLIHDRTKPANIHTDIHRDSIKTPQ